LNFLVILSEEELNYKYEDCIEDIKKFILSIETFKNVKSINLSGLTKLEVIGDEFAYSCVKLESIDLSGLTNLEIIGDDFSVLIGKGK
jgi:hypothetical protein